MSSAAGYVPNEARWEAIPRQPRQNPWQAVQYCQANQGPWLNYGRDAFAAPTSGGAMPATMPPAPAEAVDYAEMEFDSLATLAPLEEDKGENKNDIEFDLKLRGYDRAQVEAYLHALTDDYNAICLKCGDLEYENIGLRKALASLRSYLAESGGFL